MKTTDEILSYLEDEQSRFIYQKRVEYNETGDFNAIRAIVERYLPQLKDKAYYPGIEAEKLSQLRNKKKIVIFGSGRNGEQVLHYMKSCGIEPICFADNNKSKWKTQLKRFEIKDPGEIDFKLVDAVVVTPYEQVYVDAMRRQLIELGVKEEIMLNFKDFCPAMLEWEQYFDPDIIKLHENEVFVDAGVLNLGTSLRFVEECQKSHIQNFKIHAFEPDGASYRRCIEIQKSIPDVDLKLYNAGLWSEDTTLYFAEMGNGVSRVSKAETGTSIKTVALDNCVSDAVTFIKMDIEGSELEALKGCKEIIKKYRPRLAICVYHKKEDLTEIPAYIKELIPEYKLYIRHYSNDAGETVLYAV